MQVFKWSCPDEKYPTYKNMIQIKKLIYQKEFYFYNKK